MQKIIGDCIGIPIMFINGMIGNLMNKHFSVDTPPPTVSGALHIGHVFSYTHTDAITVSANEWKNVCYPMGWDDNGLPTERRVQNVYGIKCDPTIAYNPNYVPSDTHKRKPRDYEPISRQNFIEICEKLTVEDEKVYENLWKKLGLSVDWSLTYVLLLILIVENNLSYRF